MWQEIVEKAKKVSVWNTDTVFTGEEIVYAATLIYNVVTHVETTRPTANTGASLVSGQSFADRVYRDFVTSELDFADFWQVSQELSEAIQWFIKWMTKWHPDYDYTVFTVIPMTFEGKERAAEINSTLDENEAINEMLRTMDIARYERYQQMRRVGLQRWQFVFSNPNAYAAL